MLYLTFRQGENDFGLDSRRIVEVVPHVAVRAIPHAPDYFLGLLSYRGLVVPVVDFGRLIGSPAARPALNTRVVIVRTDTEGRADRRLGLLAENVDRVVAGDRVSTVLPAMSLAEAPYLGKVIKHGERLVQLIRTEFLLPGVVHEALFGEPDGAEAGR